MIRAHSRGVNKRGLWGANLGTNCDCPRPTSQHERTTGNFPKQTPGTWWMSVKIQYLLQIQAVEFEKHPPQLWWSNPKAVLQNHVTAKRLVKSSEATRLKQPSDTDGVVCNQCLQLAITPGQCTGHPRLCPVNHELWKLVHSDASRFSEHKNRPTVNISGYSSQESTGQTHGCTLYFGLQTKQYVVKHSKSHCVSVNIIFACWVKESAMSNLTQVHVFCSLCPRKTNSTKALASSTRI